MRMARRDGLVADFATDSVTSPDKMAPCGITTPLTIVATTSLAWTLAPTGVLPAATVCRMFTGNSSPAGRLRAAGACDTWLNNSWLSHTAEPRTTFRARKSIPHGTIEYITFYSFTARFEAAPERAVGGRRSSRCPLGISGPSFGCHHPLFLTCQRQSADIHSFSVS